MQRDPNQNHGRYRAADYTGCAHVALSCAPLQVGSLCPLCLADGQSGTLYAVEAGVLIRLQGQPLIGGTRYTIEKLRCARCGQQYSAGVPPGIVSAPKYAPSCHTNIALSRYYQGMPFKRLEGWQHLQGVPLADATQFDLMKELVVIVRPVYQCLVYLAPEGKTFFLDDMPNRILGLNPAKLTGCTSADRRGVYTTAMVSQVGTHRIYLFSTSHRYARENVVPLLQSRQNPAAFITMSDASPMNVPLADENTEHLLSRWILSFCLVHGRRQFWGLLSTTTPEAEFVIEQISQVYRHERECQQARLSPTARLAYHQTHSAPLLNALHTWLTAKLHFSAVELNSPLGQAMAYLLRHWQPLTRFLHVIGAPLDNSLCERAIKVAIRHRRNSLYFRTLFGAEVGDVLMSIIHTAVMNQVNVVDYLNTLQQNAAAVAREPALWLPWHYREAGLCAA